MSRLWDDGDVPRAGLRGRGGSRLAEETDDNAVRPQKLAAPRVAWRNRRPVNPYVDLDDDQPYSLASPAPAAAGSSIESRRPCPTCGEMILSSAAKCRFCGEVFDAVLKKGGRGGGGKKTKKASSRTQASDGRDLVIGFVCFAIGAGLTLASYASAASGKGGGRYFVFYGLIVGGIAGMARGVSGLARSVANPVAAKAIAVSPIGQRMFVSMSTVVSCTCGTESSCPRAVRIRRFAALGARPSWPPSANAELSRPALADPLSQGATCPICQTTIEPAEATIVCPACDQVHHRECWTEVGGCATYGCENAPQADKTAPVETPDPPGEKPRNARPAARPSSRSRCDAATAAPNSTPSIPSV